MTALISINPLLTGNARNSFSVSSDGLIQGEAFDDPASRFYLSGASLDAGETLPMWGGVGIFENLGASSTVPGHTVGRATSLASTKRLTGFSVFNQAHAGILVPNTSPVPLYYNGQTVNFYRLGSNARIAVACDPSLASLDGGSISQNVSWDFNNQVLQPYDASTPTFALNTITWANTNGGRLTVVAGAAVPFGLGDWVTISGATNTGSGGAAAINSSFIIDTYTDTTHFTLAAPAAVGVFGTIAGSPVANAGTGALNVRVLLVQPSGCKTVVYNAAAGTATWNYNGSCAVILI